MLRQTNTGFWRRITAGHRLAKPDPLVAVTEPDPKASTIDRRDGPLETAVPVELDDDRCPPDDPSPAVTIVKDAAADISESVPTPEDVVRMFQAAQERSDWEEALRHCAVGRQRYPDHASFWASEMAMLQILNRPDEAAALAADGLRLLPDSIDVAAQATNVSLMRRDWAEALERWTETAGRFPDHPHVGRSGHAVLARIDEGLRQMPIDALIRAAILFDDRRSWAFSRQLWSILDDRQPGDLRAVIGLGRALRESGEFDGAERVLSDAVTRHPDNLELLANHAQVAAACADWVEAARRWQKILRAFPDTPQLWPMAATAFREGELFDSADDLLERAIEREPERLELRVHYALVAERRNDWSSAVRRWDEAHRLRPDDHNIQNSRGDALWQEAASHLEAGTTAPEAPVSIQNDDDARRLRSLALRFEGLGDNCEFGIVQRRMGADPIGLFRFAAISPSSMIALLEERFERLGDPDHTMLGLTAGNEYLVRDDRGLYHMHSFVRKGTVDEKRFLEQQIRRLGYLKRKIIEDLTAGQKIFTYKSSLPQLDDATILRLHRALETYGPNTLLVAILAGTRGLPGTVTELADRVFVGHLRTAYSGENQPIDFASWRTILTSMGERASAVVPEVQCA